MKRPYHTQMERPYQNKKTVPKYLTDTLIEQSAWCNFDINLPPYTHTRTHTDTHTHTLKVMSYCTHVHDMSCSLWNVYCCVQVGISVKHQRLPTNITESSLLATIQRLNFDPTVHGILLQLPLDCTGDIDADKCTNAIAIEKVQRSSLFWSATQIQWNTECSDLRGVLNCMCMDIVHVIIPS